MELLAAVTLLAILGTMLFTVFENSSIVVREASGRQMVFQHAKLFMEHIERELGGAYANRGGQMKIRPLLVPADGHAIAMTTAAKVRDTRPDSITYGTEANMGRIGYYLNHDEKVLYRFEYYTLYGSDDDPNEVGNAEPFIYNVINFNVECFRDGKFRTVDWNSHSSGLPRAVRITLQLTDDNHLRYYDGEDNDNDGIIDNYEETRDKVGQTFQHVVYLGGR